MPGRSYTGNGYRYGFNGKEKDDEVKNTSGTQYDYGFRIYDPRLGKFLSVDPLFKSYPWFSPYQFAGNTPISCVDLDGLEMYFAADGSFLGQSVKGGSEIRIATKYTVLNQTNNANQPQRFIITESKPLTQFDLATAGKVYKTIYDKEIKGGSSVIAKKDETSTETGSTAKGGPISVNIGASWDGKLLNTDYYNVENVLYHENKHFKGTGSSGFEHFDIWNAQTSDESFKKTTPEMKDYIKEVGKGYLEAMEYNLQQIIYSKDFKSDNEKNYNIKYYYAEYTRNVETFNKKTNSTYKPESLDNLKNFKSNDTK